MVGLRLSQWRDSCAPDTSRPFKARLPSERSAPGLLLFILVYINEISIMRPLEVDIRGGGTMEEHELLYRWVILREGLKRLSPIERKYGRTSGIVMLERAAALLHLDRGRSLIDALLALRSEGKIVLQKVFQSPTPDLAFEIRDLAEYSEEAFFAGQVSLRVTEEGATYFYEELDFKARAMIQAMPGIELPADEYRVAVCPDCGKQMSAHALLCRDCYKRAGGARGARIYQDASDRGEASPRSKAKPDGIANREYSINPKQKR